MSKDRLELVNELECEIDELRERITNFKVFAQENPENYKYRSKDWARLKRKTMDVSDCLVNIRKQGRWDD